MRLVAGDDNSIHRTASQGHYIGRWQTLFVLVVMLVATVIIYVAYALYWSENGSMRIYNLTDYQVGSAEQIAYDIESVQYQSDGSCILQGWCVQPGVTYPFYNYGYDTYERGVYNNIHVGYLLDDQVYIAPTRLEQHDDVNRIMNDGTDYRYCGFQARIPEDNVDECIDGILVVLIQNPDGTEELYELGQVHDYE